MTRLGKGALYAGLVLILATGASYAAWMNADARAVEKVKRLARENRFPLTVEEIYPPTRVPANENAFNYIAITAAAAPTGKADQKFNEFGDPEAYRVTLKKWDAYLRAVEDMTDLDAYQPQRRGADLISLTFPEFAEIKKSARVLIARARLRAHDGDQAGAVTDLERTTKLATFLNNEHVLIGGLVKVAIQSMAARCVADLLPRVDAGSQDRLLTALDRPGPMNFDHAFRLEGGMYSTIATWKDLDKLGEVYGDPNSVSKPDLLIAKFTRAYWGPKMVSDYADVMKQIEASPTDPAVARKALANMSASYDHTQDKRLSIPKMMMPVFTQAIDVARKPPMTREMLVRATQALRSRSAPDVAGTRDVFDGDKPLKLLTTAKGWKLYSVGIDRTDNRCEPDKGGRLTDMCLVYDGQTLSLGGS